MCRTPPSSPKRGNIRGPGAKGQNMLVSIFITFTSTPCFGGTRWGRELAFPASECPRATPSRSRLRIRSGRAIMSPQLNLLRTGHRRILITMLGMPTIPSACRSMVPVRDHEVICNSVPLVRVRRTERRRRGGRSAGTTLPFAHKRNPPRKALTLSPGRDRGGSASSLLTLPPPITASSG
jgi:hypothetical protein